MLLDISHQFLKCVVRGTNMLQWLKNIVGAKFKGVCIKTGRTKSLNQANKTVFLNEQFCCLFLYPTLKILKKYNKVKQ